MTTSLWIKNILLNVKLPDHWYVSTAMQDPYEFHEASIEPEGVGRYNVLQRAILTQLPTPAALIVASTPEELAPINARQQQIVESYPLPPG
jgi:hypothetical protein